MSTPRTQHGFAMLFTVLLVSLILSIAVGISNLTLKQVILSNLAKDSGIAFYQADAAVECGLYQDQLGFFTYGTDASAVPPSFMCGETRMVLDGTSYADHFLYVQDNPSPKDPCFTVLFDKVQYPKSRVLGAGKNICGPSPRQVERALEVKY